MSIKLCITQQHTTRYTIHDTKTLESDQPVQVRRRKLIKAMITTVISGSIPLICTTASNAARAAYNVWTHDYTLPLTILQRTVEQQFPKTLEYAEVFEVYLSKPLLTMNVAENRIVTLLNLKVVSPLLLAAPLNGTITLSSRLKYNAPSKAIRLNAPRVDKVDVGGIGAQYNQQLNAMGAVVAEQVLNNYPIYTFKPDELRIGQKTFEPGTITMQTDSVIVEVKET